MYFLAKKYIPFRQKVYTFQLKPIYFFNRTYVRFKNLSEKPTKRHFYTPLFRHKTRFVFSISIFMLNFTSELLY